jgi:small subunit ribosomal protein S1
MSWSTHLRSAQDFVKVGDVVEAVILTLDRDDRKMFRYQTIVSRPLD